MRVCHLITTFDVGGAEKQLLTLSVNLKKRGIETTIVPLKGRNTLAFEAHENRINISEILLNKPFLKQVLLLRKFLRENDFDVVGAHLPRSEMICFLASPGKFYITRHNSEPFFPRSPRFVSKYLSKVITSRAFEVISISFAVRDFLVQSRELTRGRQSSVIEYGLPIDHQCKILSKQPLLSERVTYGTLSRLEKQKDLETMIRGFAVHAFTHLDCKLKIYGEGSLDGKLRELAHSLGVSHRVIFCGKVADSCEAYRTFDTLLMSSLYEGFGLVFLEALQHSKKVITSKIPSTLEIFGNNYQGFYSVGEASELSNLLNRTCHYKGTNSIQIHEKDRLKILEKFSVEIASEQYLRLWNSNAER